MKKFFVAITERDGEIVAYAVPNSEKFNTDDACFNFIKRNEDKKTIDVFHCKTQHEAIMEAGKFNENWQKHGGIIL